MTDSEIAPGTPESPYDFAVRALRDIQAARAALDAMEISLLAAVHAQAEHLTADLPSPVTERELALRSACAEIGAALRVSDRTVQRNLSEAWEVQHRLPTVLTALHEGRITAAHVQAIVRSSDTITDPEHREMYEREALARAEVLTPGKLNAVLPAVAEQITHVGVNARHREARQRRGAWVRDVGDGMSELTATLPSVLAHGIFDRLTTMARMIDIEGDDRSLDNKRADVLSDLCLGGGPVAVADGIDNIQATVAVTVPVLTLAGADDAGAHLAGSGPIDAETARRLAGAASGWDRVMTHPVTGAVLAVDRYRPSADLKRSLRVRDEHRRFPGCRMPEHRGDRDHSQAASEGGTTTIDNLALLCRRHHTMKHAANWIITHQGNGVLSWQSPSGKTYVDTPTPALRFVPSTWLEHVKKWFPG